MVLHFLELEWPLHADMDTLGLHPLDLVHKSSREPPPILSDLADEWEADTAMPCAAELSDAGIRFKESKTKSIDFRNGVLRMPIVRVYDGTDKTFLNLMAFERLHVFAGHDVTDYVLFMDSIISSERDVALLRSKGLVKSGLSSDREVAELFNTISKGAVMSPFCRLLDVQRKMNDHCRKPMNRWRATFEHTYLSNPCVFISLLAAIVVLVGTVLQVVYAAVSYYDNT